MAKSPSELNRELAVQVGLLLERDATRKAELDELELWVEQFARDHDAEIVEFRKELAVSRQENAVTKQQLADHVKQVEVRDNRQWTLILALFVAALSLVTGLVNALWKK